MRKLHLLAVLALLTTCAVAQRTTWFSAAGRVSGLNTTDKFIAPVIYRANQDYRWRFTATGTGSNQLTCDYEFRRVFADGSVGNWRNPTGNTWPLRVDVSAAGNRCRIDVRPSIDIQVRFRMARTIGSTAIDWLWEDRR